MKLIDKSALVAEIQKLKGKISDSSSYCNGWQHALRVLEIEMNTLEVKEVDLEKETKEEYLNRRHYAGKVNMLVILNESQFSDIAKHFFELGLKVSNPLTWEDVKEICVQSVLVEIDLGGKVSDERHYTEVLKRFKAQKGEEV